VSDALALLRIGVELEGRAAVQAAEPPGSVRYIGERGRTRVMTTWYAAQTSQMDIIPQLVRTSQTPSVTRLAARCRSQWRLVWQGPWLAAAAIAPSKLPSADAVVGSRPMRGRACLARQAPPSRRKARTTSREPIAATPSHREIVLSLRCSSNSSQEPWSEGGGEHNRRARQHVSSSGGRA
jgi:hypothetical protein